MEARQALQNGFKFNDQRSTKVLNFDVKGQNLDKPGIERISFDCQWREIEEAEDGL